MAGRRFTWDADRLTANLKNMPDRVDRAVVAAMGYQASRSENYMRKNASWTDRTANARNSLTARPSRNGSTHIITLSHGMPYGIWLEVRWSGKYGIIPQAVRAGGAELMALFTKLFDGLGG